MSWHCPVCGEGYPSARNAGLSEEREREISLALGVFGPGGVLAERDELEQRYEALRKELIRQHLDAGHSEHEANEIVDYLSMTPAEKEAEVGAISKEDWAMRTTPYPQKPKNPPENPSNKTGY